MKISIIGAGNVGTSLAYALILRGAAGELTLIDIDKNLLIARELELAQSIAALNLRVHLTCTQDYAPSEHSDIVIFAAGLARKDGQSRDELFQINKKILLDCAQKIKRYNENPLFIILTNPVDFLLNALFESHLFERSKIVAMAGTLDNARFKYELAKKFKAHSVDADTKLMGFHNDDMLLLKSLSRFKNEPLSKLLSDSDFEDLENEVKTGGAKVIKHLKTSAYLAPAAACVRMIEALRTGEFLPMSVILNAEFGIKDKAYGVFARLSLNGVLEILPLNLDESEQKALQSSLIKYGYEAGK